MRKKLIRNIIIIVTLLVVVIGAIIGLWPKKYDAIKLSNPAALNNVSKTDVNLFRLYLLEYLQLHGYIAEDAEVSDVEVRADTVSTVFDGETEVTSFVVDIDSLQQSFKIKIINSEQEITDVPVQISCPTEQERKYTNAKCRSQYEEDDKEVKTYLPYEFYLDSGEKVLVKNITTKLGTGRILQIYLYSCNSKAPPVPETEKLVRAWVTSLGDDEENYIYNVRTGYCTGDTI